jgi:4-amino-4-deoxy-L-arabinose transferase-like glycosyltransferase
MLFNRKTGLIAAGIAAVYPGAISQGAFVLSEAPFVPLMILQLALWGLACRSESKQRAVWLSIATGIVAGLATLTRPSWLFFTPIAALVASASASADVSSRSHLLKPTLRWRHIVALSALVLTISPWWIRNYVVTGHFVPTTLQVGASLYDGLNPLADGGSNMRLGDDYAGPIRQVSPPNEPAEYRRDQHLAAAAIDFARNNPLRALELAGIKFLRTWNIWPNEPELRSWPLRLAVTATYLPLLVLGLWGAVQFSKRGWPYVLCWLPMPYFALLHIVFVGSIRYREPAMVAMIPLAAGVVSEWLARRGTTADRG